MYKQEAIEMLGGTVGSAAIAVGVTHAAISSWPEVLPARLSDRVQAALWRKEQAIRDEARGKASTRSLPRMSPARRAASKNSASE